MDILSLAGTLLLAAAQPQQAPVAQPAPQQAAGHVKVFSGRDSTLTITKVGAGKLEATAGKVNEERPTDFSDAPSADPTAGKVNEGRPADLTDAPSADPTAGLLLPAIQKIREAAARRH